MKIIWKLRSMWGTGTLALVALIILNRVPSASLPALANAAGHGKHTAPPHAAPAQSKAGGHAHGAGHAHQSTVHTHTTRLRFSSQPQVLQAGRPATWTLQIVDNVDLTPVNDFEIVHGKQIHLVIVSSDLSWFNHLHPELKGNGRFVIRTALPRAGRYHIYADYKPQGEEGEVALHTVTVSGSRSLQAKPSLVADKTQGAWMTKTVRAHEEGQPPRANAPQYQVALMPMPTKPQAGKDVMLHFQVRDARGKPVAKLEPYLDAMGHCVILAADPKVYLHTHPMEGNHAAHGSAAQGGTARGRTSHGKADVMFHTNFPHPGLYKVWGQFQHKGKIITAPFVVRVAPAAKTASAKDTSKKAPATAATKQVVYHCPMHPEVTSNNPNATCGKCGGMKLVRRS